MDAQQFLKDRVNAIMRNGAVMAVPVPAAAKIPLTLGGSSKIPAKEFNPGPLITIGNPFKGEQLIKVRDTRVYHDPELGIYGPGAGAYSPDAGSYEARVQ